MEFAKLSLHHLVIMGFSLTVMIMFTSPGLKEDIVPIIAVGVVSSLTLSAIAYFHFGIGQNGDQDRR